MTEKTRALHLAALLFCAFSTAAAQSSPLTATLSNPTVPPGGTAQLVLTVPSQITLVHGRLTVDLDPNVFDNITAVNVFSATGDQMGVANLQGRHADVEFTSVSGGIGRLPALPILEITAPVLPAAKPGTLSTPVLASSGLWRDLSGNAYSVAFAAKPVPIGGALSIQSVNIAGTAVTINGTGFTPASSLHLEGVAWSNLQFVSATQMTFALATETELTGRLIAVQNPGATQALYYAALTVQSVSRAGSILASSIQPIFPLTNYVGAAINPRGAVALENPSGNAITVTVEESSYQPYGPHGATSQYFQVPLTIAPRGVFISDAKTFYHDAVFDVDFQAVPPVRAVTLTLSQSPANPGAVASNLYYEPVLQYGLPRPLNGIVAIPEAGSGQPISWMWQKGTPLPSPRSYSLFGGAFSANTATDDGNPWLKVSPQQGMACPVSTCPDSTNVITVSADPSNLAAGVHTGIVNIVSNDPSAAPAHIPVTLSVGDAAFISAGNVPLLGLFDEYPNNPAPVSIAITSGGSPVPITVSASTSASPSWLAVSPVNAVTPATVTLSFVNNPNLDNQEYHQENGTITVQGPSNALTFPVYLSSVDASSAQDINPNPLIFSVPAASNTPLTQSIYHGGLVQPVTITPSTASGGPWLSAALDLTVTVNPAGLAPGTYQGDITVVSAAEGGTTVSTHVPVTLVVYGSVVPLTASLTNVSLTAAAGAYGSDPQQLITISSGNLPLPLAVDYGTDDGSGWLTALGPQAVGKIPTTPAGISILADTGTLFPGTYHGHVTITAPPGSGNQVTVAVTLTVTPAIPAPGPPLAASIVNAATLLPGPLAPGEIVTIFGVNLGPASPMGVNIGPNGLVNTSALGSRVLFNGIPAPLLYSSAMQINAVVPYEIAGSPVVSVQLDANGTPAPIGGFSAAASVPGIFAILNQDGTLNSPANPAATGSIVQIFATGEGQTTVPGVTGGITGSNPKQSALPVSVSVSGTPALVTSATTAPNSVSGLFQIDARLAAGTPSGTGSVVIDIGSAASPPAIIAVK